MAVYPVIMCGGAGTRLWPASRPSRPKQFLKLLGDASPFQETVLRVSALRDAGAPVIVGAAAHQAWIEQQLAELGLEGVLLLEPIPRDSGPAMTAAIAWIGDRDPEGVAVVVASDHHIPDADAFRTAIDAAVDAAREGWIVTLGVTPSSPATAYGYIKAGGAAGGVMKVAAFVEKPDADAARAYVEAGHLWNSGNFIVRARTFEEEIARHAPEVKAAVRRALDEGRRDGAALHLGAHFAEAPRISIDYALMEKTDRAAVLPVRFVWSDVGAWDAVRDVSATDGQGNAARGDVILQGARGCLVHADAGMLAAAVGVSNLAIIAEADAVLVCDLASSQSVKQVVDRLKAEGRPQLDARRAPSAGTLAELASGYTRWLRFSALPLWWSLGADHDGGGFHSHLQLNEAGVSAPREAGVQASQIQGFAGAAGQAWPGPWRRAAEHGWSWLQAHHRRSDGLYRRLVAGDGAVLDDGAAAEDQALTLSALAALYRLEPSRTELREEAEALVRRLSVADEHSGEGAGPRRDLLEAALAWFEATGSEFWRQTAAPLARPQADPVEAGDRFRWAWLLTRWAQLSGDADAGGMAVRLAAEPVEGAGGALLWQAERLRAALILSAAVHGVERQGHLEQARSALESLSRELGAWGDNPFAASALTRAGSLRTLVSAGVELERLAPALAP